jgi:hypothetical protein
MRRALLGLGLGICLGGCLGMDDGTEATTPPAAAADSTATTSELTVTPRGGRFDVTAPVTLSERLQRLGQAAEDEGAVEVLRAKFDPQGIRASEKFRARLQEVK